VCLYVCMRVCVYVCVYVFVCVFTLRMSGGLMGTKRKPQLQIIQCPCSTPFIECVCVCMCS